MNQIGDLFSLKLLGAPQKMPVLTREEYKTKPKNVQMNLSLLLSQIKVKPYFEDQNKEFVLFKEDTLKLLPLIPDESVDMIFADPPYFLSNGGITCHAGKMVSVNKGKWDQSNGVEKNHEFNINWLRECQRILKPNGTIWVSGTSHIIYSIGFAMQSLHYKILNDIFWFKINPPPNLSCRYFTHSTETIIWAAKSSKSKHTFNYSNMKFVTGKQMKNIWQDLAEEHTKEFIKNLYWSIYSPRREEKIYGKHPTQKPMQLLERIVQASTKKGDLVLDPFNGSGTTGLEAYLLGRKYIGIDFEKEYLDLSIKRFKDIN
jgi:site-specific DNA-methyltransferase (adenine-specific)